MLYVRPSVCRRIGIFARRTSRRAICLLRHAQHVVLALRKHVKTRLFIDRLGPIPMSLSLARNFKEDPRAENARGAIEAAHCGREQRRVVRGDSRPIVLLASIVDRGLLSGSIIETTERIHDSQANARGWRMAVILLLKYPGWISLVSRIAR